VIVVHVKLLLHIIISSLYRELSSIISVSSELGERRLLPSDELEGDAERY
jgi:hypothetical protein